MIKLSVFFFVTTLIKLWSQFQLNSYQKILSLFALLKYIFHQFFLKFSKIHRQVFFFLHQFINFATFSCCYFLLLKNSSWFFQNSLKFYFKNFLMRWRIRWLKIPYSRFKCWRFEKLAIFGCFTDFLLHDKSLVGAWTGELCLRLWQKFCWNFW